MWLLLRCPGNFPSSALPFNTGWCGDQVSLAGNLVWHLIWLDIESLSIICIWIPLAFQSNAVEANVRLERLAWSPSVVRYHQSAIHVLEDFVPSTVTYHNPSRIASLL